MLAKLHRTVFTTGKPKRGAARVRIPAAALLAMLTLAGCTETRQGFDAQAWRDNKSTGLYCRVIERIFWPCTPPRGRMLRTVQDEILQVGMTREEVVDLLGEPESSRDSTLYYELGTGFVDVEYLAIFFDEEGRLTGSQFIRT